jgi:BirA family biotin operon repressor/biotin-[acetyl-CoA-carboxylase] ligase
MTGNRSVHRARVVEALQRPAHDLGVLPAFAALRPQLDIRLYETLASTNEEAWRLVEQGCGAGTVVIAREQSAGRGQWGRQWQSAAGGLYMSLILEPEWPIAEVHLLTLTSAWGIATSLNNLGLDLQVKWPNDLVSQGRKVGGILTESRLGGASRTLSSPSASSIPYVIVGVGLNWDNPLPETAISLRQLLPDQSVSPVKDLETLAAIALRGILQGYYYYRQQGSASFIQAYQQKLLHLGKIIPVDGHTAVVQGVTPLGELAIEMNQHGQKSIQSLKPGEISLGYNV